MPDRRSNQNIYRKSLKENDEFAIMTSGKLFKSLLMRVVNNGSEYTNAWPKNGSWKKEKILEEKILYRSSF